MSKPLKIFITYAHKDTKAKDELITRLGVMKREGLISIWHDNEITAGDTWRDAIFNNLNDSDILLYLVSAYSLDSENCNKELAEALNTDITVISVILEDCDWKNARLSGLQALPEKGKPINTWRPKAKGWQNVVEGIRGAISEIQSNADPSSTTSETELQAEVAFQYGNVQSLLGQIDRAIEAYSEAIYLNPRDAKTYNNRGVTYGENDESDLAIRDFDKAIELKRDFAFAYNNRGAVYRSKGEYDLAIEDCNKAIQLKSDYSEPYSNRGSAYRNKGEIDRAIEDYDIAIKLKPNFVEAYYNRGLAYHEKGDLDRALKDYRKAIELDPKLVHAYNNRGNVYLQKHDFDRAIADYDKAIELDPKLAPAYCNRGGARLRLKEWDKARSDLTVAKNMGVDIAKAFHGAYEDISTFERENDLKVPKDIVVMLTQP
jgi:tetratricopeptide (TPR) repeat protein